MREPNLNDVVDFLSSEDLGLVSNAASYLQHLAYGDDSMKAKIRSVLFPYWYEVWESNRRAYSNSLTANLEKLDLSYTLIYGRPGFITNLQKFLYFKSFPLYGMLFSNQIYIHRSLKAHTMTIEQLHHLCSY